MADEFGGDAALAVELLFKREDDQHALDVFAHEPDAVLLPGPELRADEVDDGNAEAVELLGEAEMNLGKRGGFHPADRTHDGRAGPAGCAQHHRLQQQGPRSPCCGCERASASPSRL
jgi:hypothetical protein